MRNSAGIRVNAATIIVEKRLQAGQIIGLTTFCLHPQPIIGENGALGRRFSNCSFCVFWFASSHFVRLAFESQLSQNCYHFRNKGRNINGLLRDGEWIHALAYLLNLLNVLVVPFASARIACAAKCQ